MDEKMILIRTADENEKDFYFKSLYPMQDRTLDAIRSKDFYLTGGTALSRFYFHHRFSDDLDFFFNGYSYPQEQFNISYRKILYSLEKIFDKIEITIDGEFFKRIFVNDGNTSLKIEFIYENYKTVGKKKEYRGILVDSKENICANKIGAISDRRTVKDFFDLFFLLDEVRLEEALKWSEFKKVPADYEGIMMASGDLLKNPYLLEGEVLTIKTIDHKKFINFIKKIIGDLLSHAKNV